MRPRLSAPPDGGEDKILNRPTVAGERVPLGFTLTGHQHPHDFFNISMIYFILVLVILDTMNNNDQIQFPHEQDYFLHFELL